MTVAALLSAINYKAQKWQRTFSAIRRRTKAVAEAHCIGGQTRVPPLCFGATTWGPNFTNLYPTLLRVPKEQGKRHKIGPQFIAA